MTQEPTTPAAPSLADRLRTDLHRAQRQADDANALVQAVGLAAELATQLQSVVDDRARLQRLVDALNADPDAEPDEEGAANTAGE